jgi:hypothetical protein
VRSCLCRRSYLPVSIRSGETPYLNLAYALICFFGILIVIYLYVRCTSLNLEQGRSSLQVVLSLAVVLYTSTCHLWKICLLLHVCVLYLALNVSIAALQRVKYVRNTLIFRLFLYSTAPVLTPSVLPLSTYPLTNSGMYYVVTHHLHSVSMI